MRPKHWVKNILIFLPLIFSGKYTGEQGQWLWEPWIYAAWGFVAWSLLASAGYIINDLSDIQNDRLHPLKRKRPLASGEAKVKTSWALVVLLIVLSIGGTAVFPFDIILRSGVVIRESDHILENPNLWAPVALAVYLFINWSYSTYLKRVRFLDIAILSSFYLQRIILGSIVTTTPLTNWFIATTAFIFMAMSFNKRKMECDVMKEGKISGRAYTLEDRTYLNTLSVIFGVGALFFLNLHSIHELEIVNPISIAILNLLVAYVLALYFDDRQVNSDDPVEKLLGNKQIIIGGLGMLAYYLYYFIQ